MSLPDKFEIIVVGTGLVESIVAAAGSRLGHSVLHIDTTDNYGGDWASFTWDGLQKWIKQDEATKQDGKDVTIQLSDGEEIVKLGEIKTASDITESWFSNDDDEAEEGAEEDKWSKSRIEKESRRFNIDLSPRLLFSRGPMVELLISSNISRYTEFKSVSRVLTLLGGQLEHVPSSRADVFGSKHVTVVEKRILMKFLTFCLNYDSSPEIYENFLTRTYLEFLKHQKLTENLIHFVLHSIAMVTPSASCVEGLAATKKFLTSLGRFGNTPFLWSMYGSGELPQAFCRLCAVFGGVYYLGRSVDGVVVAEDKCVGVVVEGQKISCDYLVLPDSKLPPELEKGGERPSVCTSRGVFLSTKSMLPAEKEQLSFVSVPPSEERREPVHVIEVSAGAAACPKQLHLTHASCKTMETPSSDLSPVLSSLHPAKDSLVYSLTFLQSTRFSENPDTRLNNIFSARGPTPHLDFDDAISEAREIYRRMYPEDEFLPRAPDPEEIVIGEQEDNGEGHDTEGDNVVGPEVRDDPVENVENDTEPVESTEDMKCEDSQPELE